MKYLINHSVLFDTLEYQLSLANDPSTLIRLSNTSGRVLAALISSHGEGQTVSREWLFEIVWSNHGLQPSNGNLNQQISLIRKALVSLGLDNSAIVTVPKRGLKLNDQLIINDLEEASFSPAAITIHDEKRQAPPPSDPIRGQRIWKKSRLADITLAISLMVTLLMSYVYFISIDKQPLLFLDQVGTCDVYTFRPVVERERELMITILKQSMKGNIAKCNSNNLVLFSHNIVANSRVREKINQRIFLAKCEKDAKGNLAHCLSFYFYNWAE